ncbi:MAG: 50S ribosomal protein L13 [Nanoarchaeota archaeon]|nr:50S ribosomal protein L13 [Nanoarchaeota archaeon]
MTQENKTQEATIIDAKDLILGRLGSVVAKRLLMGEEIKIVNCKDIVVLGNKKYLIDRYKTKLSNKVVKQGPYYSRSPADMVRRSFRNMLPYKNQRGIEAYKRLKCYNSTPSILLNSPKEIVEGAKIDEKSVFYYSYMGDICKVLGYTKVN